MSLSRRRVFGSLAAAAAAPIVGTATAASDALTVVTKTPFQRLYECWEAGGFTNDGHDLTVTVHAVRRGEEAKFYIGDEYSALLLDSLPADIRSQFKRTGATDA